MRYKWTLLTKHPVATNSLDHLYPLGTLKDNSGNLAFVWKMKELGILSIIDLGCSGGKLVKECHEAGLLALGLEGSDISQRIGRAEWVTIPSLLFTCDLTKPFEVLLDGQPFRSDVVTAWEFMEHIAERDLEQLFKNLNGITHDESLFICSIANFPSLHKGVDLHRTLQSAIWWDRQFECYGWYRSESQERYFAPDWVRTGSFTRVYTKI